MMYFDPRCGLMDCGRKLLNLLPSIGDGEEGTVEFEVRRTILDNITSKHRSTL